MNVAHINATVKRDDGVTGVMMRIIRESLRRGYQAIVITGYVEEPETYPVRIVQIPSIPFPLYPDYYLPISGLERFEKELTAFKPDLIHLHSPDTSAWMAVRYAQKNNIPIIATYHTDFAGYAPYYHLSSLKPVIWSLLKNLYQKLDLITCSTQVSIEELKAHRITNTTLFPFGADLEHFSPSLRSEEFRKKYVTDADTKIVLFVARLVSEKNLVRLVKTYELLRSHHANIAMIVVGDGPSRSSLEREMPGAVFLGSLQRTELATVYASCDIFLFPSDTETFGLVTLEAMASGLVPVVAAAGGSKAVVTSSVNGLTADPKNANQFYKHIRFLLEHPEDYERLRAAALRSTQHLNWDQALERLFAIYADVIARHASAPNRKP